MNYNAETLENPGKYVVTKGPTVLYKRSTKRGLGPGVPIYTPYTMDDNAMLVTLRDALIGDKRARESSAYERAYVRVGWVEPGFNSLRWLKLSELVDGHYNNTLTSTEKRKLMEVAKLLFISIKSVPRTASFREQNAESKRKKLRVVA